MKIQKKNFFFGGGGSGRGGGCSRVGSQGGCEQRIRGGGFGLGGGSGWM